MATERRNGATSSSVKSPNGLRVDSTWDQILATSAELFARNGYHATGISELIQTLGISRGALYFYIDGKQRLLYEISRTQVERLSASAAEIARRSETPAPEKLRLLARSLLANIAEHQAEWTVFFTEVRALTGAGRAEIFAARDAYENHWREVLEEGVAVGDFRHVDPVVVKGILGMCNYTYLWFRKGGPISSEEVADIFIDMVLQGLMFESKSSVA